MVTASREVTAAPLQTIDIPVSLIADPVELKGRSIEVTFSIRSTDAPGIHTDVDTKFFNR